VKPGDLLRLRPEVVYTYPHSVLGITWPHPLHNAIGVHMIMLGYDTHAFLFKDMCKVLLADGKVCLISPDHLEVVQ